MKQNMCYSATHIPSGKRYIEITYRDLNIRKSEHISHAKHGSSQIFHNALNEYGSDCFEWKVEAEGGKDEMMKFEHKLNFECNTQHPEGFNYFLMDVRLAWRKIFGSGKYEKIEQEEEDDSSGMFRSTDVYLAIADYLYDAQTPRNQNGSPPIRALINYTGINPPITKQERDMAWEVSFLS